MSKKRLGLSLFLKDIVLIAAIVGTLISAFSSKTAFMGGSTVFMFFTIQSNIAIAVICVIGLVKMLQKGSFSDLWYIIKFVGTVSITLTGVVFCFVLAPTLGDSAWNIQNILTHVVVPVVSVADFFVIAPKAGIHRKNVIFVIIPPILYAIYAAIGYVNGWEFADGINYPYFFLNWGSEAGAFGFTNELPFLGCVWWILILLIFLVVIGYAYLAIADLISRRKRQ